MDRVHRVHNVYRAYRDYGVYRVYRVYRAYRVYRVYRAYRVYRVYVRRTFMYNVMPAFPERTAQQLRTLSHILRRFHSVLKVLRFPRFKHISET